MHVWKVVKKYNYNNNKTCTSPQLLNCKADIGYGVSCVTHKKYTPKTNNFYTCVYMLFCYFISILDTTDRVAIYQLQSSYINKMLTLVIKVHGLKQADRLQQNARHRLVAMLWIEVAWFPKSATQFHSFEL